MRQCRFYMGGKRHQSRRIEDTAEERRIASTAEKSEASPRWTDGSGTEETGLRSDPTHVCIGASAGKNAVQGNGSQ